jgi:hypothetical protein
MAHEYITLAEIKESKEMRGLNFADLDLAEALETASRAIDDLADRRFWLDDDATQTRYYEARSWRRVPIDDLVTLASLSVDQNGDGVYEEVWVQNRDFVLEPPNAPADGEPWERIRVHPAGLFRWGFPCEVPRAIKVVGRFGWPAIPAAARTATLILASRYLERRRSAPLGVIAIGLDVAVRLARTDPDVAALVETLQRHEALVA